MHDADARFCSHADAAAAAEPAKTDAAMEDAAAPAANAGSDAPAATPAAAPAGAAAATPQAAAEAAPGEAKPAAAEGKPGKSYDIPRNSIVSVKLEAGKEGLGFFAVREAFGGRDGGIRHVDFKIVSVFAFQTCFLVLSVPLRAGSLWCGKPSAARTAGFGMWCSQHP